MTNDLEKQFFDTFGIEPKRGVELTIDPTTDDNVMNEHYVCYGYPQITDTHYLKLICELSKCKAYFNNFYRLQNVDIEQLKEQVLTDCIFQAIFFKHQVKALFEEG